MCTDVHDTSHLGSVSRRPLRLDVEPFHFQASQDKLAEALKRLRLIGEGIRLSLGKLVDYAFLTAHRGNGRRRNLRSLPNAEFTAASSQSHRRKQLLIRPLHYATSGALPSANAARTAARCASPRKIGIFKTNMLPRRSSVMGLVTEIVPP